MTFFNGLLCYPFFTRPGAIVSHPDRVEPYDGIHVIGNPIAQMMITGFTGLDPEPIWPGIVQGEPYSLGTIDEDGFEGLLPVN